MKNEKCKGCDYYVRPGIKRVSAKYSCGWTPAKQKEGYPPCNFVNEYGCKIRLLLMDQLSLVATDSFVSATDVREAVDYVKVWLKCQFKVCTIGLEEHLLLLSKIEDIVLDLVAGMKKEVLE